MSSPNQNLNNNQNNNYPNNKYNNHCILCQNPDLAHLEYNSKPNLKCIEVWQDNDEYCTNYAINEFGIKCIIHNYNNVINRPKLQLKFIDLENDINIYLDVSNSLKAQILKIINDSSNSNTTNTNITTTE